MTFGERTRRRMRLLSAAFFVLLICVGVNAYLLVDDPTAWPEWVAGSCCVVLALFNRHEHYRLGLELVEWQAWADAFEAGDLDAMVDLMSDEQVIAITNDLEERGR